MNYSYVVSTLLVLVFSIGCDNNRSMKQNWLNQFEIKTYDYASSNGKIQRRDYHDRGGAVVFSEWFRPSGAQIAGSEFIDGNGIEIYLHEDGGVRRFAQHDSGSEVLSVDLDAAGKPHAFTVSSTKGVRKYQLDGQWKEVVKQ